MNQENNTMADSQENLEDVQNVSENEESHQDEEVLSSDLDGENEQEGDSTSEINEWKDQYLRLVADFDNHKKRTSKERIELIQVASRDVMESLLDVLDDMDRAETQLESSDDVEQLKEGVKLVFGKLRKTLNDKGLKSFDSVNKDFDVELHEAITEIPAPSEEMNGKVMDEVQKGYYLNDKLLRHAKVVVGKNK